MERRYMHNAQYGMRRSHSAEALISSGNNDDDDNFFDSMAYDDVHVETNAALLDDKQIEYASESELLPSSPSQLMVTHYSHSTPLEYKMANGEFLYNSRPSYIQKYHNGSINSFDEDGRGGANDGAANGQGSTKKKKKSAIRRLLPSNEGDFLSSSFIDPHSAQWHRFTNKAKLKRNPFQSRFPIRREDERIIGRIAAYSVCEHFEMNALISHYLMNHTTMLYRDTLHIHVNESSDVFFFAYGVVICWNLQEEQEQILLKEIMPFQKGSIKEVETDDFDWLVGKPTMKKEVKIVGDEIILKPGSGVKHKLAISHGIAQSTKLSVYEGEIENIIDESKSHVEDLAKYGKISLSRSTLSKKMGVLFLKKNAINLHSDLLDTPEWFWEHKRHEPLYELTKEYLDIAQREKVLNKRLDIVQELFEMLSAEKLSRHEHFLEWIIIWLIIAEVIFEVASMILSYFVNKSL